MDQVHKRFTAEQVRVLLKGYCQGTLDRLAVEEVLGIGKTRFFALLRQYRRGTEEFSLAYQRATPTRLPASPEKQIEAELMLEKGLIEDPSLPISNYNYAAIRDRLASKRVAVSSPYYYCPGEKLRLLSVSSEKEGTRSRGAYHRHWRFNPA
jgi:hypothetical protein